MRADITVFWRGDVCMMQTFSKARVIVGDAPDADVVLPIPRTVIVSFGDHVHGDFVVRFSDVEKPWLARARLRPHVRSMLASFVLHATILALAFFFAMRSDPREREAARLDSLRGYISRLAENPHDPIAHVDAIETFEEKLAARPGTVADAVTVAPVAPTKPKAAKARGGGSGHASGGSSCAAYAAAAHDPNSTWIEFSLNDEGGRPVEGEPYRVTLPDGTVREGKTDKHGLICFTGVKAGNAQIEWPRSGNAVHYVNSSPKPS